MQQLTSNTSLLAAICSFVTVRTLVNPASLPIKRIVFYHFASALLLHRIWRKFYRFAILTEKEFDFFLTNIAATIHQHSSVGLIEESHMRTTCHSSLNIISGQNSRWRKERHHQIVNDFVMENYDEQYWCTCPMWSRSLWFFISSFSTLFHRSVNDTNVNSE